MFSDPTQGELQQYKRATPLYKHHKLQLQFVVPVTRASGMQSESYKG
jgi:hypothetical protein